MIKKISRINELKKNAGFQQQFLQKNNKFENKNNLDKFNRAFYHKHIYHFNEGMDQINSVCKGNIESSSQSKKKHVLFNLSLLSVYKISQNNHLKHRHFKTQNQYNEILHATLVQNRQNQSEVCIIFLHGYGSNKQQGYTLIDYLPKQMDICCFDFSASGKSQGKSTTYGLKQFRDIRSMIAELKKETYGYKKFILWGRSMGAVASFLMMCSQQKVDEEIKKDVIYQVLDSPFSSFQSICYYQGKQAFRLPETFISYGIDVLKSSFKDNLPHLNPFNIDLVSISSRCQTNTLFIYSEGDDIIPQENTISIIQKLPSSTNYEKLLISQNHNALRSHQTNIQIFQIVQRNYLKYLYNRNKTHKIFSHKFQLFRNTIFDDPNAYKQDQINQLNLLQSGGLYLSSKNINKQKNPSSGQISFKDSIKKEKKYLQLLSPLCEYKQKNNNSQLFQDRQQLRNQRTSSKQVSSLIYSKLPHKVQRENTLHQIIDPQDSSKDLHRIRRTRTLDLSQIQYKNEKRNNYQSLLKIRKIESSVSSNTKKMSLLQHTQDKNKNKKRALYCSLKKQASFQFKFQQKSHHKNGLFTHFNTNNIVQ